LFLATNLYVGLAGGLLAYTCALLQGMIPEKGHFLIAFGYIFAMHNMNRFTDQKSKKINDPMRAIFYQKYRWPLLIASSIMLATALTLAYSMGKKPFWLLVAMSLLGVLYSVRFIPKPLSLITRVRGLKEIPGSRAFFVATAWAFVTVLIPVLGHPSPDKLNGWVLLFALLLVYVRNALFDVFEVQGDRIVGKETLPVFIGKKRTLKVLHIIMGLLLVMLIALPLAGQLSNLAWWLIPGVCCFSVAV
jgi:4-hydroxy-3-methylbut-2-enyl diphosphate reductase